MYNEKDYEQLLKEGKEIIVIGTNVNEDSSIFYERNGKVVCYNRNLGEFTHPKSIREIAEFFCEEVRSGAVQTIVRGCRG